MKRKLLTAFLILMVAASSISFTSMAAATMPTAVGAPENFAASNYGGFALFCTLSAPDDLRALVGQTLEERGFSMKVMAQVDFKTDGGSWHYSSDWDNAATYAKYALDYGGWGYEEGAFLGKSRLDFKTVFPEETNVPVQAAYNSWDWYKSHTMTLRARFAIKFYIGSNVSIVFSDWSKEYVLSNSSKMDYKKIMNENAPTLISSKIEILGVTKVPWVVLSLAQHPDAVQLFNAASGNSMWTEIWLRKSGDKEFKNVISKSFSDENLYIDVSEYFGGGQTSYDAQGYEVKVRYKIDEREYQQSGATSANWLYSQFSNTLSYNMPAWSKASDWSVGFLDQAEDLGIITDRLSGQDMTQPITREEFAETAVKFYEMVTGQDAVPASTNPFKDCTNPEVLKALNLRITAGTGDGTTFEPNARLLRQQMAVMITNTLRACWLDFNMNTAGQSDFKDQKSFAAYSITSAKFMAKYNITAGDGKGNFIPNNNCTRQEAITFLVKAWLNKDMY